MNSTRRDLLRGATVTMTAASYSRVMGANDKVRYGIIGAGDRGQHDLDLFANNKDVEVTAVCDVYAAKIDQVKTKHPNAQAFKDHRALLERKDIDIVQITTPDHWHAAIAIDALNAGKDVYCEKPLTLKIEEGPEIVKAARVNERVCQVGMQQRSGKHYLQAKAEYIDTHKLGKITLCRTWWHGNTYHLRTAPASLQTKPSEPRLGSLPRSNKVARLRSAAVFQLARLSRFRRRAGDGSVHALDRCGPHVHGAGDSVSAQSAGGVYNYRDGRTAPDTINVLLQYPAEFTATFEGYARARH